MSSIKAMRRVRFALIFLLSLLLIGSCAAGLFRLLENAYAAENIVLPAAFSADRQINQFVKDGKLYVNYQTGYVVYAGETADSGVEKAVGNKNFSQKLGRETFLYTDDTFAAGLDYANRVDAPSGDWVFGYAAPNYDFSSIGETVDSINAAFRACYHELAGYDTAAGVFTDGEKYNPGIWFGRTIEFFPGTSVVYIPLAYGDGTGVSTREDWFPSRPGLNYLSFNSHSDKVYLIADEYVDPWLPQWGEPVGNAGEHTFKVNGEEKTFADCQMFTNGYAVSDGETVTFFSAEYDYDANNYGETSSVPVIAPPEAYPEFYGQQVVPTFAFEGKYYLNYRCGYVEATPVGEGYAYVYRYGYNIDRAGEESFCALTDVESMVHGSGRIIVSTDPGQAAQVGQIVPEAEQAAMLEAFKAAYARSFGAGQVAGIPASYIYVFNGSVIQNYVHGDGNGNNGTEAYILYDPAGREAHVLTQTANTWLNSASTFGTAVSDYGTNAFSVNGTKRTVADSQLFASGWLADGVFTQAIYDSLNQNYITIDGFGVPGVYGNLRNLTEEEGIYYINYEHGAVTVEDGTATMYPARNFNESFEPVMQDIEYFLDQIRAVPIANNADRIRAVLLEKYTELFEQGYFPGFADAQGYAIWNDTECLQFFWSDSIAVPFNVETDARTNVLFIHVELGDTAEEDAGYVVRDRMLEGWNKFILHPIIANSAVGAPLSDMTVDGDCIYQQFRNYLLICVGDNFDAMVITKLSYEEWKAAQAALPDKPDYGGDYIDYTEGSSCGSSLSAAVMGASAAALAAAVVLLRKKSKEDRT